jgi:hypothetical protein
LTVLGEQNCEGPEEFKAWSQNLGHDNVLTTFTSYGNLTQHRQVEILQRMAKASGKPALSRERPLIAMEPERLEKLERMIADISGPARTA